MHDGCQRRGAHVPAIDSLHGGHKTHDPGGEAAQLRAGRKAEVVGIPSILIVHVFPHALCIFLPLFWSESPLAPPAPCPAVPCRVERSQRAPASVPLAGRPPFPPLPSWLNGHRGGQSRPSGPKSAHLRTNADSQLVCWRQETPATQNCVPPPLRGISGEKMRCRVPRSAFRTRAIRTNRPQVAGG